MDEGITANQLGRHGLQRTQKGGLEQMRESERAGRAFGDYLGLGEDRSLERLRGSI